MKSLLVVVWLVIIGLAVILSSCEKKNKGLTDEKTNEILQGLYEIGLKMKDLKNQRDSLKRALKTCSDRQIQDYGEWIPGKVESSPEDAGPYTPTRRDSLEWGLTK